MDLTQITIAQTRHQNQPCFDRRAHEAAMVRRERQRAALAKTWRGAWAALARAGETLSLLPKMALRREVG